MDIHFDPEMQKFIEERLRSGAYGSPEEIVLAGLGALRQQEYLGDFAPGELDFLLAEGENDIAAARVLGADEAMNRRRLMRES